ncbi:putative Ig domain-containing protein [Sulfuricurvum sp.]|uniref:putative Ig domain-containing protein n=1 Tax=Sulfuricurvum sp. TaxID=2025608 RepID=UPI00262B4960|nr:putative Ig domain-containing protein [Sulfuricurvum sp.]MDD2265532.1 putative Ig domain-containing protein [Sulfuricurvum sp.]MDD2783219.1 putative Ig domain-containing protein [Sulfuricurvum sp.]
MNLNKFFVRWIMSFGILMMFAVTGWGASSNNPTVTFTPLTTSISEGSGDIVVSFSLSISAAPDQKDVVIGYQTTNGTAISPTNYNTTSGTITFSKNVAPVDKPFSVTVHSNAVIASNVSFSINLTNNTNSAQNVTISNTTAAVTITHAGAPVMGDIPNQDIVNGIAYTLNIASYVSGSDIESYHLNGTLPTGLSFDTSTGVLSGTPNTSGTNTYSFSAYATNDGGNSNSDDFNITISPPGAASDLLIVKTPSKLYSDVNQTLTYNITLANETSSAISASFTDTLRIYDYNLTTGTVGSEVTGVDFNISIINQDVFSCSWSPQATSFSCSGTVPKRTGNNGVPGLVSIIYTITTPSAPDPSALINTVRINGTSTEANATVIVKSPGSGGGEIPVTPPPEHADVIDTAMWTDITAYNNDTSKVIGTKISAQTGVSMTAVHLDGSAQATPFNATSDSALSFVVIPYLSDGICSTQEILYDSTTGLPATFNITNGNTIDTKSINFPAYATKNARISVSFLDLNQLAVDSGVKCYYNSSTVGNLAGLGQCVNSANKYYDAFGLSSYERCQVLNGRPCDSANHGQSCGGDTTCPGYNPLYDNDLGCLMCTLNAFPDCSSDNFAIRPNYFSLTSVNTAFPNLLRSAEDYNMSINTYNYDNTTPTVAYNVANANSIFTIVTKMYDKNDVERNSTTVPRMLGTASFSADSFDMLNGISVKSGIVGDVAGFTFDDVGKINISIQDQNWSYVDINNPRDLSPHSCLANGTFNGAYVCGDKNVTFIPHHFDFSDLNITNNNGNPGTFTYIANEITQMAGRINTTMHSLNKNGNVTHNFASDPLWENNVTVVPVVVKSTYIYPDANETIINNLSIGFTDGNKTVSWDANSSEYLRFNFQRDVNLTANPFDVNGSDLNISITSHYVDTSFTPNHTADINGSRLGTGIQDLPYTVVLPADGNTTFVYGRIIPRDVRVFGDVPFTANAWYEVYNEPNIKGTILNPSKNEALWYINRLHEDETDGDGNITVINPSLPNNAPPISYNMPTNQGIEIYSFTHEAPTKSAKAHIQTAPWLWYGVNALPYQDPDGTHLDCLTHPCFNINIVPDIGATGSAKGGAEDKKASKKSDEGGGSWRSTTDYAPAIR